MYVPLGDELAADGGGGTADGGGANLVAAPREILEQATGLSGWELLALGILLPLGALYVGIRARRARPKRDSDASRD